MHQGIHNQFIIFLGQPLLHLRHDLLKVKRVFLICNDVMKFSHKEGARALLPEGVVTLVTEREVQENMLLLDSG